MQKTYFHMNGFAPRLGLKEAKRNGLLLTLLFYQSGNSSR